MGDKLSGRIENSQESGSGQFSQPWTPQSMQAQLDRTKISPVPSEFGNLQLVDNGQQMLKGSATYAGQYQQPKYESIYTQQKPQMTVHHDQHLRGDASDQQPHGNKPKVEYLVGETTIPASNTIDGYKASEKFSAKLPASTYQEGAHFNQVINVPAEKGKHNYYNGLAQAHYEHGHLLGVPAHMVNGKMVSHLDHEIDIPLHKKK